MAMTFDSLRYAQRLQQVGVSREQAEAHAELARDMLVSTLATRSDVAAVQADVTTLGRELRTDISTLGRELRTEMAALRRELEVKMEVVEQRMTVKLGAMIAAAIGLIVAAQKLL